MKKIITTLFAFSLVGCATITPPTSEQQAAANYGPPVSLEHFNKIASADVQSSLIDPDSLRFTSATNVTKYWAGDRKGNIYYGYFGCYGYNAKNRMGGYSGTKTECALVRGNDIIQTYRTEWHNHGANLYSMPPEHVVR